MLLDLHFDTESGSGASLNGHPAHQDRGSRRFRKIPWLFGIFEFFFLPLATAYSVQGWFVHVVHGACYDRRVSVEPVTWEPGMRMGMTGNRHRRKRASTRSMRAMGIIRKLR